jgi:hypothetical protein
LFKKSGRNFFESYFGKEFVLFFRILGFWVDGGRLGIVQFIDDLNGHADFANFADKFICVICGICVPKWRSSISSRDKNEAITGGHFSFH